MNRYNIDLKGKPFYLTDEDIKWVENTFESLDLDGKIGQLFMDMLWGNSEDEIVSLIDKYQMSGFRYNNMPKEKLYHQNKVIQENTKIPALIAANVENGGNGAVAGGTYFGDPVAIGATQNKQYAYDMAYYGSKEAAAVGCNWTFAPVVDINMNWRSSVVSNRCFSSEADQVLEMGLAYMQGAKDAGLASCAKHFPGDGLDERDQHIVATLNDLEVEDWDNTFGKVYKGLIDAGIPSLMIGHILMPHYSRALRPGIKDKDIMPATLAEEILNDLLRDRLNFNGVVLTDATHMVGLTSKMKRSEIIPSLIERGCDMILYYRDKDEDIASFKAGLENGLVSQKRLDEAVIRVLAFKASLKLHEKQADNTIIPEESGLDIIGSEEHLAKASEIADAAITLVKNTENQLPLNPQTHKRIMLYSIDSTPSFMAMLGMGNNSAESIMKEELEKVGFEVDVIDWQEFFKQQLHGKQLLAGTPIKEFTDKYDAVILVANVVGFSQSNVRRIEWNMPMGPDIPWYVKELPTIFVSVENPFHLIDVPMVPTYINAYNSDRETIRLTVEKIIGKSEFKGVSSVDVFCSAWDTRL